MFSKILLAIDLNDPAGADRVGETGGALAKMCGAELHLLSVVPDLGYGLVGAAFGPDYGKKMIDEATAAIQDWAAKILPEGIAPKIHVLQGTIYDRIIHEADALGVDLIVVGSHRPELKDYLVGPNATRVMRHAHQTVLVVR